MDLEWNMWNAISEIRIELRWQFQAECIAISVCIYKMINNDKLLRAQAN